MEHPSKQQVRQYMQERNKAKTPPPTPEQIRRELGWSMLQGQKR
jgi:hypothetical protein